MATKVIKVESFKGISVLAASRIYKEMDASGSKAFLYKDNEAADASSVLDILALGADENSKLKVIVYGENEEKIVENVTEILIDGAGI
jgi:phosphotransferase system HPr (HPr) family protein